MANITHHQFEFGPTDGPLHCPFFLLAPVYAVGDRVPSHVSVGFPNVGETQHHNP